MSKLTWVDVVSGTREKAQAYLNKNGYENYNLNALVTAQPVGNPVESGVVDAANKKDPRPRAEIVATARLVYFANLALNAHEGGDHDRVAKAMHSFGRYEVFAEVFKLTPQQAADFATNYSSFLSLMQWTDNRSRNEFRRMQKTNRSKKDNLRKHIEPRNSKICEIGAMLRAKGVKDRQLTTMVINYMFDHDADGKKVKDSGSDNLWLHFGEDPIHGMTPTSVLGILRAGGIRE